MEKVELVAMEWWMTDGLEKAEVRAVREEVVQVQLGQRQAASRWYYMKIMIAIFAVCALLWQRVSNALPATQVRQVDGVPQYVLDYGMLWHLRKEFERCGYSNQWSVGVRPWSRQSRQW